MLRQIIFVILWLPAVTLLHADDAPAIVQYGSVSTEMASEAAWGALKNCRQQGYSVAVAVVDRGGNLQALVRDKLAGPHTVETAIRKAWTANSFRQSTSDLAEMMQEERIPSQVQHNPGALQEGGGLKIDGSLLGGIGVSGAPPGESEADSIDGKCAQAGIDSIQEALDFSGE